jgi:hypothetical protein
MGGAKKSKTRFLNGGLPPHFNPTYFQPPGLVGKMVKTVNRPSKNIKILLFSW